MNNTYYHYFRRIRSLRENRKTLVEIKDALPDLPDNLKEQILKPIHTAIESIDTRIAEVKAQVKQESEAFATFLEKLLSGPPNVRVKRRPNQKGD